MNDEKQTLTSSLYCPNVSVRGGFDKFDIATSTVSRRSQTQERLYPLPATPVPAYAQKNSKAGIVSQSSHHSFVLFIRRATKRSTTATVESVACTKR